MKIRVRESLVVAVVVMGFVVGEVRGQAAGMKPWSEATLLEWWREHPEPDTWKSGAEALRETLVEAQKKYGVPKAVANRHFLGWVVHLRWLDLFPEDYEGHPYFSGEPALRTYKLLSAKQTLPRLLANSLAPEDDGAKALELLCRIAEAHPEKVYEYPELAVAMAVVFDEEFPEGWPHPFAEKKLVVAGDLEVERRFAFYVQTHEAGGMMIDPRELSVKELSFLVDSILAFNELKYVQQVNLKSPDYLAGLYQAIEYDYGRSTSGQFQWPHATYGWGHMGPTGGICADQAFFISQTGKAKGVPTILFMGQGRSGGHAWVGYLKERADWNLDGVRSSSEKYPVGVTYDPQTWRRMTDTQLKFVMADMMKTLSYQQCQLVLQWAAMNRDEPFYREVVVKARESMPRYFATWELEAAWLREKGAPAEHMEGFWKRWISTFRDEIDMKTKGQIALLQHYQDEGDERSAERLKEEMLRDNRSERFDLGITVAASSVLAAAEGNDWKTASEEYDEALDRFKRNAGGHLLYNLVQPYVERCLEAGQRARAVEAMEDLDRVFKPKPNTMLDQDLEKLRALVESG
jgi:hypothetical protein